MASEMLNLWGNGSVTLPKKWRERYKTKHFMARENERGNLEIIPIVDVEYVEDGKGNYGLRFPLGIEAGKLKNILEEEDSRLA